MNDPTCTHHRPPESTLDTNDHKTDHFLCIFAPLLCDCITSINSPSFGPLPFSFEPLPFSFEPPRSNSCFFNHPISIPDPLTNAILPQATRPCSNSLVQFSRNDPPRRNQIQSMKGQREDAQCIVSLPDCGFIFSAVLFCSLAISSEAVMASPRSAFTCISTCTSDIDRDSRAQEGKVGIRVCVC